MKPLPFASTWLTTVPQTEYVSSGTWSPAVRHLWPGDAAWTPAERALMDSAMFRAVPTTLVATQYEDCLVRQVYPGSSWHTLPNAQSGRGLDLSGNPLSTRSVDPLGPKALWQEVGEAAVANPDYASFDGNRPILLSNNEADHVWWPVSETSKRFVDAYGTGNEPDLLLHAYLAAIRDRYNLMFAPMRDRLANPRLVGYRVGATPHIGRWADWRRYSWWLPGHYYHDLGWDGASSSGLYLGPNDERVYSPFGESMTCPSQDAVTFLQRPDWWSEISVYEDTDANRAANYPSGYTPARFRGLCRWLAWTQRPRVLRHFAGWGTQPSSYGPWLAEVVGTVNEVHTNLVLANFWQDGELVLDTSRPHPWTYNLPPEIAAVNRMSLLRTSAEEPWPTNVYPTNWPVRLWAMALRVGDEFLVLSVSPGGARSATVTVPGFGEVAVNATPRGSLLHIRPQKLTELGA